MKLEMKQLESGLYAVVSGETPIIVCKRAYNAHLIATILEDDEKGETTKKVGFKE